MSKKTFLSCLFFVSTLGLNAHNYNGNYDSYDNSNMNSRHSTMENGADASRTYYTKDSSNTTMVLSDSDLTKKIKDKISSGIFVRGYDNVTVRANNGNVTLQGSVKNMDEKAKVEAEVRKIDGVKTVDNQIMIQDPSTHNTSSTSAAKEARQFPQDKFATSADEQLNIRIRDNVSRGWLWNSYKDVSLDTANGVVTIKGTVGSESDQQKLINEVQKVDGVKSVKANLTIK